MESGAAAELQRERARAFRANAILLEQRRAVRAARLVPIEDVIAMWNAEQSAVQQIVTKAYTSTATAARVLRASKTEDLAGVERTLKELAYEVLRELANPDRRPMPGLAPMRSYL